MTVERWRRTLSQMGVEANVVETAHLNVKNLAALLERLKPDLIHAHHAIRAGAFMIDSLIAERYEKMPFIVSAAGTDINDHAQGKTGGEIFQKVCRRADFILSQSSEILLCLRNLLPDLSSRISYVPKSFLWHGNESFDLRAITSCRTGDILFFMPAGIRPVKGNLECLRGMEKVHEACPNIRIVFAGPILDVSYADAFREEINRLKSFAQWMTPIPPQKMYSAYQGADVILNHSQSESFSNALLEALAAGRPILAADIPGNWWLKDGRNGKERCGCLFDIGDPDDFIMKAIKIATDLSLRTALSATGFRRAQTWPKPSEEAQALLNIYETAIASPNH